MLEQKLSVGRRLLAVFCGGFFGAICRYLLSSFILSHLGKNWPFDILFINLSGAFALALITTLADARIFIGPTRRLLLNVGFLGAYTTFSSLMLGDVSLLNVYRWFPAISYLLISMLGGLLAVLLGDMFGQRLIARSGRSSATAVLRPLSDHIDIDDDLLVSSTEDS